MFEPLITKKYALQRGVKQDDQGSNYFRIQHLGCSDCINTGNWLCNIQKMNLSQWKSTFFHILTFNRDQGSQCAICQINHPLVMDSKDLSNSKKKTNLGLMKIVKQLKRNEIKLIDWLINIQCCKFCESMFDSSQNKNIYIIAVWLLEIWFIFSQCQYLLLKGLGYVMQNFWIGLDYICLTTTHVLQDILAVLHK